jgi:hypothetical protein
MVKIKSGHMEMKYYSLGTNEKSIFIKFISIVFGIVCIVVAFFWIFINIKSLKTDLTLWITILFLLGFGFYQIWSGLGRATTFIEIGQDKIRIKNNFIQSPVEISAVEIQKIDYFPLNIAFILKSKKRLLLRFGTTYQETNQMISGEIVSFAEANNIPLEIIEEKI